VAVELHSSIPDRFQAGMQLLATNQNSKPRELEIEGLWPHKGALVLKFAGIDSISAAETLLGCELQVPWEQRAQLDAGWNYVSDLAGCRVFNDNIEIGAVEDVQFGAGEAPLLIVRTAAQRHEIPYAGAYLKHVDVEGKRIDMSLPEGMLDLNSPLTAEEKREQGAERKSGGK
jgi:16S rRNA processing protein RimM